MSNGEVRTWYMTEEERLAYIEKHPIATKGKPHGTVLSKPSKENIAKSKESKARSQTRITDNVDKEELRRRFLAGESGEVMAAALKMSVGSLHYCIRKFRELEPERWPRRVTRSTIK